MTRDEDEIRAQGVRKYLCQIVGKSTPITYQALAKALDVPPPNSIHKLTQALEWLIIEDVAKGRPIISSLVISKARGGLPAPGFFDCAAGAGRLDSAASEQDCARFFEVEFKAAEAFWRAFDASDDSHS